MNDITIIQLNTSVPQYQQVWQLREDVLRKPLGMSLKDEDLSADAADIILLALEKETPLGCVMLHPIDAQNIKLRQMAVAETWQGKGIGKLLVEEAEKISKEKGYSRIVLHARQVAIGFYEKMGYQITSALFTEVGIPHKVMEKELDN